MNGVKEIRIKVYVDDTLIYTGKTPYSSADTELAVREDISKLSINATSSAVGSVMIDNLSYWQSDKTYSE